MSKVIQFPQIREVDKDQVLDLIGEMMLSVMQSERFDLIEDIISFAHKALADEASMYEAQKKYNTIFRIA